MSEGPTIGDWTQHEWLLDDASSFPARVRLRDAAWMVYYEPDAVVQRERAERLELREQNAELRKLCADLHKLADESYVPFMAVNKWMDELADIERRMREFGIEVPDA